MVWNLLALGMVILLIVYLAVEIHVCRKRMREGFTEVKDKKALPPRACASMLDVIESQQRKQQMLRQRLLKATPESNPELDHQTYDYCYVRDFDHQNATEYAPACDPTQSSIYNNSMVQRVFLADVKDQDSLLNVPRQVCVMELERDKINVNNVNSFIQDLNTVDTTEFMEDMKKYQSQIAELQKANADLATTVSDMRTKLSDTQHVVNKEATASKQVQIELRAQQLQQQSDIGNKAIIMDDQGQVLYETNAPTTYDTSKLKGLISSVILPKQNSFRVSITTPKGEYTFTSTDMNIGAAGIEAQRVRVL